MKVVIIGGHGKVALRLATILSDQDHEVTSVIRNPAQSADVADTGAEPYVADVEHLDTTALVDVVSGQDAVVWAAGAGGGSPERTYAVDRDAAIRVIDAAEQAGVPRFVMLSYFGASLDHQVPGDDPFFAYAEAKAAADQHLRDSALEWTIVAPSALTDKDGTGQILTAESGATASEVSRDDVAEVIAEVLATGRASGRMVEFNNGTVPISEALAAL
ncbi:NAD-dependent dehydratase [Flavimobilis marinus]|uniref:Putative NADH-flavin reductase n=1 Tax=Flavimobilis marinus TaxID=285351 RepID=A0A1I2HW82_9MICO|nr:SDR family oxidoreductase [Flavimobilis marinus]GHG49281.1 NAD-dependent dehydratase [Flavimobilis marinus]SFF33798.1 Putative NADH-flavin reductase [Flavimobilis marinus]